MLMSSGENFTNQDSGCHMSENATGEPSQANATLTESITFKSIDKHVKFPSKSEVDFKLNPIHPLDCRFQCLNGHLY